MKRSPSDDAPPLFDLPLAPPGSGVAAPARSEPELESGDEPRNLDLFAEGEAHPSGFPEGAPAFAGAAASVRPSTLRPRVLAGLLDLAVCALVLVLMVAGTRAMKVSLGPGSWPALLLALGVFSFLYYAIPLAFWGQTPGMARLGLVARNEGDQPLTFGQTFLRWLAAVLTLALAGMPALLVLTGRSAADRLSGSRVTLRARA